MARQCFMCGRDLPPGKILCENCDKPRRAKAEKPAAAAGEIASASQTSQALALDRFPEAPIVQFPVESATPAITSVVNLLVAAGTPSVFLGADRSVKFVSDAALKLFDKPQSELMSLAAVEAITGIHVGDLGAATTSGARIRNRNVIYSLVPMSGGASGAVMVFRETEPADDAHASFVSYVQQAALEPLRSLRDALKSSTPARAAAIASDAARTIDQILGSLEMAPGVGGAPAAKPIPRAVDVVRRIADRFTPVAAVKGVQLQVDVQDFQERFGHHEQLGDALAILMENALHYVPAAGMIVIGVRWMEHKGHPIFLFFVMDNGPVVPDEMKHAIFEPGFVWDPSGPRTGRGLFKAREFAVSHGGSVWVDAKTGKACTFFLRIPPDALR
ncbi:MAG: sensor histidine kinase [Thermoanaerobaculia bacterium]